MKNILKNNHNYSQNEKKNHIFSEIAILIILRSLTITFESLQNYQTILLISRYVVQRYNNFTVSSFNFIYNIQELIKPRGQIILFK